MGEAANRPILKRWVIRLVAGVKAHAPYLAGPLITAWLAYAGVASCGFIGFDDNLYVFENLIVSKGLTLDGIKWALTAFHASTWQPLVWLSFMLDVEWHGVDAAAMHITNLLLHLLNVALVYVCWRQLTHRPARAAMVALLFAIHPLHVESVAWIAERKDVLSTVFWWLTIIAYGHYNANRTLRRYALVLLCFTVGLLAKPMLMTLPAVLLLVDIWPLNRIAMTSTNGWRNAILEKLPLLAPAALSALITYHVQTLGGSVVDTATISLWGRISNACVSYLLYVGKLIWPIRLAVLYPHPGSWSAHLTLLSLAAIVAALVWTWRRRREAPWEMVGVLWFLGTLLPVIGLIQIGWHAMADRFVYVPAIGLYVVLVWSLSTWLGQRTKRLQIAGFLLAIVVVVALLSRTRNQVSLWHDSIALFSHATAITRDNWMMHNCCGAALARAGRDAQAIPHFESAIRLRPERPRAHYNLGCVKFRQQKWPEAIQLFSTSAEIFPSHKTLYNLAAAQKQNGQFSNAEKTYLLLLDRSPNHTPSMNNLGCLYRELEQYDKAVALFDRAIATDSTYLNARFNLAVTLMDSGSVVEAMKQFVDILQIDPTHAGARAGIRQIMAPADK
ncbi:MAG: tetratricopeptide repeat protein [Verrucomicrobia bacterium]|jgi:protein O-mannosyl-transferase|nr:tetratricopeptide repeat protein [Verrucomicrobiota bacterium]